MRYHIYKIKKEFNSTSKRSTVYTVTTRRSLYGMQCGQIKLFGMRKFGQEVNFVIGNQRIPGTDFDRDTKYFWESSWCTSFPQERPAI